LTFGACRHNRQDWPLEPSTPAKSSGRGDGERFH